MGTPLVNHKVIAESEVPLSVSCEFATGFPLEGKSGNLSLAHGKLRWRKKGLFWKETSQLGVSRKQA